MNPTLIKFGYPDTRIKDYKHWAVLLRPEQVTLASLVLINTSQAQSMKDLSPAAFAELANVTADIETVLQSAFAYDKISYLCFMLNDPNVHFHVLPRYSADRDFAGATFKDPTWPGHADLSTKNDLSKDALESLRQNLEFQFNALSH